MKKSLELDLVFYNRFLLVVDGLEFRIVFGW